MGNPGAKIMGVDYNTHAIQVLLQPLLFFRVYLLERCVTVYLRKRLVGVSEKAGVNELTAQDAATGIAQMLLALQFFF